MAIMKKHNFWTILLLIAFSFSISHAFVIETKEADHCSVQEYIQEFSQSSDCCDVCDVHHMFHMSYIIVDTIFSMNFDSLSLTPIYNPDHYNGSYTSSSFRPPIAI